MKKTVVDVRLKNGEVRTVKGYEFNVDGLKLVVHKGNKDEWIVTERITGARVLRSITGTRKAAVQEAEQLLRRIGVEAIQEKIREVNRR